MFQVVPPCGGHRSLSVIMAGAPSCFKSCPRVGGIGCPLDVRRTYAGFKSCPRVGGIRQSSFTSIRLIVSSRAPVWGASRSLRKQDVLVCFKSCPRVGGIGSANAPRCLRQGFKSCPRVGGIQHAEIASPRSTVFQVVPPCGGHQAEPKASSVPLLFQVVPPCGGHLGSYQPKSAAIRFQVVPPCGGHPCVPLGGAKSTLSFKSCPRVGGIQL